MSKIKELQAKFPENFEIALLSVFDYQITNKRPKRYGGVTRTHALSRSCSSQFGFDVVSDTPVLAVPDIYYPLFRNIRWYKAHIVEGQSGLFLVFDSGVSPDNRPTALRIFLRMKQCEVFARHKQLLVVRMDKNGVVEAPTTENAFPLDLTVVERFRWEDFKKKG